MVNEVFFMLTGNFVCVFAHRVNVNANVTLRPRVCGRKRRQDTRHFLTSRHVSGGIFSRHRFINGVLVKKASLSRRLRSRREPSSL